MLFLFAWLQVAPLCVAFLILPSRKVSIDDAYAKPLVRSSGLHAAPKRLLDNADGVLYVNDRCIDCATCSHFAPTVFSRTNQGHHIVHRQPSTEQDIDTARAALSACPVAAIRIETSAHRNHRGDGKIMPSSHDTFLARNLTLSPKINGRSLPFPRKLTDHVWYLGHHNERSFGATPYIAVVRETDSQTKLWIMIDTPRYCQSAVDAVTNLTGPAGPDYLLLTHVDDTADHGKWKIRFPTLQRIFHANELGPNNWLGDVTLEEVEILIDPKDNHHSRITGPLQRYNVRGKPLSDAQASAEKDIVLYHTPGHSPGSMSLFLKCDKVLFTGDTLGYTERTKTLTGFPRFGNDLSVQVTTIDQVREINWDVVAPGHGHARDYRDDRDTRNQQLLDAKLELHDACIRRRQ